MFTQDLAHRMASKLGYDLWDPARARIIDIWLAVAAALCGDALPAGLDAAIWRGTQPGA